MKRSKQTEKPTAPPAGPREVPGSMPERHLQSIWDNSVIGLYRTTPDGTILYVNAALVDMLGFTSPEELKDHNLLRWGYAQPHGRDRFLREIEKEGRIHALESLWTRKDGTSIAVIESAIAIRDAEGKTLYYDGSAQDVTGHRRLEQELRTNETRLRVILQSLPIAIYTAPVDPTVDAIWISGNSEAVTGYTAGEYTSEQDLWRRRLHPEDRDRVLAVFAGAHADVELNVEYRWMVKSGEYRWFLDRSVIRSMGTGRDFIGVIVDVTARKQAEDLLRRSEERFRLISQSTVDLISVLDLHGKVVYRNPAYVRMLGEDAIVSGRDAFAHIHPEDRQYIIDIFFDTVATGEGKRAEYRFIAQDGSIHTIESQGSVIRSSDGTIVNIVVVSRDVTEKRQLEQQLLRMQRMESLGTLAGGVAHDLNNFLSPMLLGIELLKKSVVGDEAMKLVETLGASARRGSDIVKQILAFARGIDGDLIPLPARKVIFDILPIIRETFPKSLTINVSVPDDVWSVIGNATQLNQVILNLCVNARDAMPDGGRLTISACNLYIDAGFSRMYPQAREGKYVLLSVEDSGTGIPPELMNRIFDPFFSTKQPDKGTGLGLSTTYAIVKAHKGFINVHSIPGTGTRFDIYLPAAGEQATGTTDREIVPGKNELLLVVDPEESILHITRQSLEVFGYRVLGASSGDHAVRIYSTRSSEIAAAIVDTSVATADGQTVLAALRHINHSLPCVLCRSSDGPDLDQTGTSTTPEIHISKPYTARTLIKAVTSVLHGSPAVATGITIQQPPRSITRAIVRPPGLNFFQGLTTANLGRPDYAAALLQHQHYCTALRDGGVDVIALPVDLRHPDGTFVEDTAVLTPNGAILTHPGDPSRAGEIESVTPALEKYFPAIDRIEAPGTVDGGDVCEAGDRFFIGISKRTNEEGARQLAAILGRMGLASTFVDIRKYSGILHLKSGISYLGNHQLAVWESLRLPDLFKGYELIPVPPEEEYAANCLLLNDRIFVASGFPAFEGRLRRSGRSVVPLNMSEFQKMDGGLSCLSLRF